MSGWSARARGAVAVVLLAGLALGSVAPAAARTGGPAATWGRLYGTVRDDVPSRVAVDREGGVYVVGVTDADLGSPVDYALTLLHAPAGDALLVKYDRAGDQSWSARFGGPGYDVASDVALDAAGHVYVAGWVAAPLPGQASLGATDAFLRKYDPRGLELWTRQFGTAGVDVTAGLAVDAAGRAVVALASGQGPEVRAFGPDGGHLWTRRLGPASHETRALAVDAAGTVYAVGVDHRDGAGDALVQAIDAAGALRWTYRSGTAAADAALGVAVGPDAVYVVGRVVGALPGQTAAGRVDAFLRRLGPDGGERWVRQFGTEGDDAARGVALAGDGRVLVAGMTGGRFERGAPATADAFVGAFAADGRQVWTHRLATPGYDVASDVAADGAAAIVVGPTVGAPPGGQPPGGFGGQDVTVARVSPVDGEPATPSDGRRFAETGFRIDHDAIRDYVNRRGGVPTFGYPVSRTFRFRGVAAQLFQRRLVEVGPDGRARQANLLDGELMPYTRVNGATFPAADPDLILQAPPASDAVATLRFVQAATTNVWRNTPVNFLVTFLNTVTYQTAFPRGGGDPNLLPGINLEMWGLPTSAPAADPNNARFVYQRFQRGLMHFDAATGTTQAILLGDYLKAILTGRGLPADLDRQTRDSRLRDQYQPGRPGWMRARELLPGTDLTEAFEPSP